MKIYLPVIIALTCLIPKLSASTDHIPTFLKTIAPVDKIPQIPGRLLVVGLGGGSDIYTAAMLANRYQAETNKIPVIATFRHTPKETKDIDRLIDAFPGCNNNLPNGFGLYKTKNYNQKPAELIESQGGPKTWAGVRMEERVKTPVYIFFYPRNFVPNKNHPFVNLFKKFLKTEKIQSIIGVDTGGDVLGKGTPENKEEKTIEGDIKAKMVLQFTLDKQKVLLAIVAPCIDGQTSASEMAQTLLTYNLTFCKIKKNDLDFLEKISEKQDERRTTRTIVTHSQGRLTYFQRDNTEWAKGLPRRVSKIKPEAPSLFFETIVFLNLN